MICPLFLKEFLVEGKQSFAVDKPRQVVHIIQYKYMFLSVPLFPKETDCAVGNYALTMSRNEVIQYGQIPTYPEGFRMIFVSPMRPKTFKWTGVFYVFGVEVYIGLLVKNIASYLKHESTGKIKFFL